MENITFEKLPSAVQGIFLKLEKIERLLIEKKPENHSDEDQVMTVHQAADFIDLSPQTVYKLVSERNIPHSKRGKRLYFSKSELKNWIKEGKRKTLAELK